MTKELHQKREGVLRVINCTQPQGQQVSLIATDKRILCYRPHPNSPWEPMEPKHLGVAAVINRFHDKTTTNIK